MRSIRIIIFLFVVLIAAFLSLAGRCFYLQYFKSGDYIAACARQQQGRIIQMPQRGVILDRRGRVLAASSKIQTVFAEPRIIKDPKETSAALAPILDMGAHEICKLITDSKNPGFAIIKAGADTNRCGAAAKIHGVGVQSGWVRNYPMGSLTSHVVGFTSADNRGLAGIELQYDEKLSGSSAQNIFFADALRRPIRLKKQDGVLSDGAGVILTLDAAIQQFARAELLKQYLAYQAESAVAVVADAKTGAILALVSLPDFEPNNVRAANSSKLSNHAVTDQYEPGSSIKPVIAALAIDAGVIGRNEKIYCEDGHYRGKGFGSISEYGGHRYESLTVGEILTVSSNIGMAKIGQKLGKKKLHDGMKRFGFGSETALELQGEAEGFMAPLKSWTGYSETRIPFGQEISVTAIQLVRAFCILANGGRAVQPFIVRAIVDGSGKIVERKQSTPSAGVVIAPEVTKWIITDALVDAVNKEKGTGKLAKLEKWKVFGKTGTANIASSDRRGYAENAYIASFIGGAPAEDPKVIVLVSIRRPNVALRKGYTGGTVAAPVVGAILEKTLTYLEKHPL
ncbi:MAG: penicillin-binding protein 2 [Sedimentisphaerales bacterium]|nr:penicillin-binding protein 2 [Sedimentisphaerales bacterium]